MELDIGGDVIIAVASAATAIVQLLVRAIKFADSLHQEVRDLEKESDKKDEKIKELENDKSQLRLALENCLRGR